MQITLSEVWKLQIFNDRNNVQRPLLHHKLSPRNILILKAEFRLLSWLHRQFVRYELLTFASYEMIIRVCGVIYTAKSEMVVLWWFQSKLEMIQPYWMIRPLSAQPISFIFQRYLLEGRETSHECWTCYVDINNTML